MITAIKGDIITPDLLIPDGVVVIEHDKIMRIETKEQKLYDRLIDFGGNYVTPGFIDLHVHGGGGYNIMHSGGVEGLSKFLIKGGVTSYLPTTYPTSHESLLKAVRTVCKDLNRFIKGASPLGIHLESPYINPKKCGALNRVHVRPPNIEELKELQQASGEKIKIVTLAPEVKGALETIEWLSSQSIIPSAGHTDATYVEMLEGIKAGVSYVSHLFNAMRAFHHRGPGVVGAALTNEGVNVELIADGYHLHPATLTMVARAKGPKKVALVSDCIATAGLPEGAYDFGGQKVYVKGRKNILDSGHLAGSTIRLSDAITNMVRLSKLSVREATEMATATPARIIGVSDRKGRIAPGMDADVVVLDRNLSVKFTMIEGNIVYKRE